MSEQLPLEAAPLGLGAALQARGFERLTAIQSAVLAPETEGRDLRISSQTGSGKTVALGLAIAPSLVDHQPGGPAALIVAPTRELATQLARELTWLFAPLSAKVVVVTGGTSVDDERARLDRRPAVVVGTPGRLVDHLRRGSLALDRLRSLVLDEADEMLDMGFEEDLNAIFACASPDRRTVLVSATFGGHVRRMADRIQKDPLAVCGTVLGEANADIEHVAMWVPSAERFDAVVNLLLRHPEDKTLLFARTRADAQELASRLAGLGFAVRALSGDMTHRERTATFAEFRAGVIRVLVATDVAARGLDVDDIARVIQVDLPENGDVFTHRSGRTGRAGRQGQNVVLAAPSAAAKVRTILRSAGVEATAMAVPTAQEIHDAADERLRSAMLASTEEPSDRTRALAARLLEDRSPQDVVAFLLAGSQHAGPCAPRTVSKVAEPRPAAKRASGPRDPKSSTQFVTFQVSWGAHQGADARRLLALVCRRGGVSRDDVGAISVAPKSSTVEVAETHAAKFEAAVQRPDPRDPRVRFRRWQPGATTVAPRPAPHKGPRRNARPFAR